MISTAGNYGFVKKAKRPTLKSIADSHGQDTTNTKIYQLGKDALAADYGNTKPTFRVYPKPAVDHFKVSYNRHNPGEQVTFTLFTRWGQATLQRRLSNHSNTGIFIYPGYLLCPGLPMQMAA